MQGAVPEGEAMVARCNPGHGFVLLADEVRGRKSVIWCATVPDRLSMAVRRSCQHKTRSKKAAERLIASVRSQLPLRAAIGCASRISTSAPMDPT